MDLLVDGVEDLHGIIRVFLSDAQLERIRNTQSSKDSAVLKIFGIEEGRFSSQRRFQD